jgi:hypothetical protein
MRASEYDIWRSILRDHPPDGVCERWRSGDGEGYLNFVADLGTRPSPRHRLVRLDADGCFSGGNCRWSDSHRRRGVPRRLIVVSGRQLTLREASDRYGVDYVRLCKRLERGWSVERALDVAVPPSEPSG